VESLVFIGYHTKLSIHTKNVIIWVHISLHCVVEGFSKNFPIVFAIILKRFCFLCNSLLRIKLWLKFSFEIGFFKLAKVTFVHLWCFCLNCFLNMKFRDLKELFIMFLSANNGIKVKVHFDMF